MAENFYEMYLEEMELIRPLDQEEEKRVLAAAARADKEAGNRLVEGNLARALAVAKEYEGKELPISDLVQEANMALMMAVTEYDGSQEWPDFAETKIRQAVEAAALSTEVEMEEWDKSIEEAKKIATDEMGVEFIDVDVEAFKEKVLPLHESMLQENEKIRDLYDHIQAANEKAKGGQ